MLVYSAENYVLGRALRRMCAALPNEGIGTSDATSAGTIEVLMVLLAPLDAAIRARDAAGGHL